MSPEPERLKDRLPLAQSGGSSLQKSSRHLERKSISERKYRRTEEPELVSISREHDHL